jgi:hypothetical protein
VPPWFEHGDAGSAASAQVRLMWTRMVEAGSLSSDKPYRHTNRPDRAQHEATAAIRAVVPQPVNTAMHQVHS